MRILWFNRRKKFDAVWFFSNFLPVHLSLLSLSRPPWYAIHVLLPDSDSILPWTFFAPFFLIQHHRRLSHLQFSPLLCVDFLSQDIQGSIGSIFFPLHSMFISSRQHQHQDLNVYTNMNHSSFPPSVLRHQ